LRRGARGNRAQERPIPMRFAIGFHERYRLNRLTLSRKNLCKQRDDTLVRFETYEYGNRAIILGE
jgi:hypothetical protein